MDRLISEEYNIECMLITDNQAREDELVKEYERREVRANDNNKNRKEDV